MRYLFIELCLGEFILYCGRDYGMWSVLYGTRVLVLLPVCPYHKADGFGSRNIPVPVSVEGFAGTGVFVLLLWVGRVLTPVSHSPGTQNMMLVRMCGIVRHVSGHGIPYDRSAWTTYGTWTMGVKRAC